MSRHAKFADCHPEKSHYARGMCLGCYQKAQYQVNRAVKIEKVRGYQDGLGLTPKDWYRYRKFGIRPQDWIRLLEAQQGRCGACGEEVGDLFLDLQANAVRGLVCRECQKLVNLPLSRLEKIKEYIGKSIVKPNLLLT